MRDRDPPDIFTVDSPRYELLQVKIASNNATSVRQVVLSDATRCRRCDSARRGLVAARRQVSIARATAAGDGSSVAE
jgi:hypothetical protein